jgi:hypothetical protein
MACGGKAVIDGESLGNGGALAVGGGSSTASAGNGPGPGSGGAGGAPPEPLRTTCPGPEIKPCMTDLYAVTFGAQWGNQVEFVGMDGSWVAGSRATNAAAPGAFALWLDDDAGLPPPVAEVTLSPPPDSQHRAIDVIELPNGDAEMLTCAGSSCFLFAGSPGGLSLVAPPFEMAPEGLVYLGEDRRCVFGDGVACLEGGSWTIHVPAASGPTYLAGASGTAPDDGQVTAWIVGEGGAIGRIDAQGFTEVESPTTSTLRAVTADIGSEAVAAGDDGTVVILNDTGASALCTAVGDDWRGVTRRYDDPDGHDDFALLSFGSWYVKNATNNSWCNYAVESDVPVVMDHVLCGSATNWRILLKSRVYVGKDCEP